MNRCAKKQGVAEPDFDESGDRLVASNRDTQITLERAACPSNESLVGRPIEAKVLAAFFESGFQNGFTTQIGGAGIAGQCFHRRR